MSGQSSKIPRTCLACNKAFEVWPHKIREGGGRYCSRSCYHKGRVVSIEDRFWKYVGKKTPRGCILWAGAFSDVGYGTLSKGKREEGGIIASRVSYELFNGPIPEGLQVCHICDVPACINPVHLFVGTAKDNARDKVAKGRSARGEKHGRSILTIEDVREVRIRVADGESKAALAAEKGVDWSTIYLAVKRRSWSHVE